MSLNNPTLEGHVKLYIFFIKSSRKFIFSSKIGTTSLKLIIKINTYIYKCFFLVSNGDNVLLQTDNY